MNIRPLSVTIIGWLFIATGIVGVAYHATELNINDPFVNNQAWVLFVRLLAIIGGNFTLRGANWARWLLLVWIAYHIYLSFFHTLSELVIHSAIFVGVAIILFHPKTSAYFKSVKAGY